MNELQIVARCVKSRRKNIGMSQQALADKIGVNRRTIMRLENEKAELGFVTFLKICKVLGMKTEDFIGEEYESNDNI